MMMPANFSAVSENEMTYVMGGSVADYLAPAMGAAQWQIPCPGVTGSAGFSVFPQPVRVNTVNAAKSAAKKRFIGASLQSSFSLS